MKFVAVLLAAGAATVAAIPASKPQLETRAIGVPGAAILCLAECAPLAECPPCYAACLAVCTAAGVEEGTVDLDAAKDIIAEYNAKGIAGK